MAKTKVTVNLLEKYYKPVIRVAGDDLAAAAISTGVKLIKGRTRSSKDMSSNQEIGKQKPLTPFTIRKRLELSKFNATHPAFKASRSNLTLTGQLLDAVIGQRIGSTQDSLRLRWTVADSSRSPYRTGEKSVESNTPSNLKVAQDLASRGRKFIGLDNKSREQITKELTRVLRRTIGRLI